MPLELIFFEKPEVCTTKNKMVRNHKTKEEKEKRKLEYQVLRWAGFTPEQARRVRDFSSPKVREKVKLKLCGHWLIV